MAEKLAIVVDSLRRKESSLRKAYDELLQTQAQLVQSEKMAAIGELVASVVHEMRNPLCSVKLNYQIIGRTIGKESPLLEHYRIGLDQVSQLERMFSNLLDYSKPISLNITPFHLNELIEQSLQQLDPLIKEMRTRIERKYDNMLPPMMGDGEKIRQVLVNIIRNGIEAAGCEGKVEISAGVGHSEEKPVVMLDIIDNGPGISPQDVKRIFQPFFTTKQKGTGLGLSIVKKIVEAHQYRIDVCSEEGHGTVVSLRMQGR
jgi:signal transduction histidine kinase